MERVCGSLSVLQCVSVFKNVQCIVLRVYVMKLSLFLTKLSKFSHMLQGTASIVVMDLDSLQNRNSVILLE